MNVERRNERIDGSPSNDFASAIFSPRIVAKEAEQTDYGTPFVVFRQL